MGSISQESVHHTSVHGSTGSDVQKIVVFEDLLDEIGDNLPDSVQFQSVRPRPNRYRAST